jgi:hypothetical protein
MLTLPAMLTIGERVVGGSLVQGELFRLAGGDWKWSVWVVDCGEGEVETE